MERAMKRLLVVPALVAILSGCGTPRNVNANYDVGQASASYKYKTCPVSGIEFDREPGGYIGPFGWRGRLSEDALAARAAREAAEQSPSVPCPVPYARQAEGQWRGDGAGPATIVLPSEVGGVITAPNFGGGETVYSAHECIGAVVNGACYGLILPDYSRPHPTCYGQMINGICTGAML
jgi:hypothetical protein